MGPMHAAAPGHDRLESWKDIAAYLSRDIRTVQRWERNEGLPVHRHMYAKQGSVYALCSELDAWRQSRDHAPARPDRVDVQETPGGCRIRSALEVGTGAVALAVDVVYLEPAQLGAAHARGVKGHQYRAVEQVAGGIDEPGHLLRAQDVRQLAAAFGKRQAVHHEVALQRLDVEEAEPGDMLLHGPRFEFAIFEQVGRIFADLVRAEQIGSGVVMFGEIPDDPDVRFRGILGVITTPEFLQHHLS